MVVLRESPEEHSLRCLSVAMVDNQGSLETYNISQANQKTTPCPKKTKKICFCQNFVKFPPILIIFGRKIASN